MKKLTIISAIIGVLIITGILVAGVTTAEKSVKKIECKDCNGLCDAETNCGLETCGAVNGGSCNCGRK